MLLKSAILCQTQGSDKPAVLQDRFGFLAGKLQVNRRGVQVGMAQDLLHDGQGTLAESFPMARVWRRTCGWARILAIRTPG